MLAVLNLQDLSLLERLGMLHKVETFYNFICTVFFPKITTVNNIGLLNNHQYIRCIPNLHQQRVYITLHIRYIIIPQCFMSGDALLEKLRHVTVYLTGDADAKLYTVQPNPPSFSYSGTPNC